MKPCWLADIHLLQMLPEGQSAMVYNRATQPGDMESQGESQSDWCL